MSFGCFLFLSEVQEASPCLICNQQLIPAAVCMMAAGIFVLTEAVNLIKQGLVPWPSISKARQRTCLNFLTQSNCLEEE